MRKSKSKFWKVPRKSESQAIEEKKSNSSMTFKGIGQSPCDVRKYQLLFFWIWYSYHSDIRRVFLLC